MGDVAIPKTIRIRNTDSEMDSVRVFLEENLKLDSREKEMTCLLICEEMITRLLQSGNDEVTVAVKGLLFPRIVLISQHPMDDGQDLMKKSESECEVQVAIESIMGKCTIIMVAHRLNTIRKADVIYRFEGGLVTRCDSTDTETPTSDSPVTDSMLSFTTEQ